MWCGNAAFEVLPEMFNWEYLRGETYVWALQMMMMMASQAEKVVMTLEEQGFLTFSSVDQ